MQMILKSELFQLPSPSFHSCSLEIRYLPGSQKELTVCSPPPPRTTPPAPAATHTTLLLIALQLLH